MRQLVTRGLDRLADVEGRYLATVFFSVLLMYTLVLVFESLGYAADARLFPLIIGIPLSIMIVGKIILLLVGDRLDLRVVGIFEDVGNAGVGRQAEEQNTVAQYRREFSMILWVGGLIILTYLIGNLAAVPLFIFAFIYVYEGDLRRAGVAAIVAFVFIYLLFIQILDTTLWPGVVPISGVLA